MLERIASLIGYKKTSNDSVGKTRVVGIAVPTDGDSGYAIGCTFSHTDGGQGDSLYINEGTYASCAFKAVPSVNTAQAVLQVPVGSFVALTGAPLIIFADGAMAGAPSWNTDNEAAGIRWEHDGTPDPVKVSVPIPADLDATADVVVHLSGYKVGATAGDTINWTVGAFNNVVGALWDADTDFGGDAGDFTNTTKLVQEHTVTLALADVAGSPTVLTLTINPKDGELATDDVVLLGVWLEYSRKTLTA